MPIKSASEKTDDTILDLIQAQYILAISSVEFRAVIRGSRQGAVQFIIKISEVAQLTNELSLQVS